MAKVMISLPDDLLARVDGRAAERGSTRSATIRELIETTLGEREQLLATRMSQIEGSAARHGGNVADAVKMTRPS
jgi:metal-responsive CopG/Arc/MetJ family transcriptional regulator